MRGSKTDIKETLKGNAEQLHSGQKGITKCKKRASCSVWWPEITSDIEEYNEACRICCQYQKPRFEPLFPTQLPEMLWQKIGIDHFE